MTHIAWVPHGWREQARAALDGHGRAASVADDPPLPRAERRRQPDRRARRGRAVGGAGHRPRARDRGGRAHAARRARAKAPASIVQQLLISDLPVFLRWRGEPPWDAPELEQLVDVTDRLIVDSTEWDDLPERLSAARGALLPLRGRRTSRGHGRRAGARISRRSGRGSRTSQTVRVRGTEAQAWLLCGWLRSRLGRPRDRASSTSEAEKLEAVALDGAAVGAPSRRSAGAERRPLRRARALHAGPGVRSRGPRGGSPDS